MYHIYRRFIIYGVNLPFLHQKWNNMNKTVELVNEWAKFEERYPEGNLEDFCRYYLIYKKQEEAVENRLGNFQLSNVRFGLMKAINRLNKLWLYYSLTALKPLDIGSFDEYTFLLSVDRFQPIKKTDIVNGHFFELSSGFLIIDRLLHKGLIIETADPLDKRSKRLSISAKGIEKAAECRKAIGKVAETFFEGMFEEDITLCEQLLGPHEKRVAGRW